MKPTHAPNKLLNESSPYLQQHAYNPVDWYPWGEEALNKAKEEDKPIILSIGYSACHWCHVMERESFENEEIAGLMNKNFICIKVDREERPDVDQVYMDAIQAMGLHGGWPLNVFLTPSQKPFYGGTYFPPAGWAQLLQNVAQAYKTNRRELEDSAEGFTDSLAVSEAKKYGLTENYQELTKESLEPMYQKMAVKFDRLKGGMEKAPKFPMPANWKFLARYYAYSKNDEALKQLKLTLTQMAHGGIFDQLGGGFARYSVDANWFAPHFEKMLYDNAQLISLYAEAYNLTREPLYKEVVYKTISFVENELLSENGGFYSALDADSEGEEGKFYVWKYEEVEALLQHHAPLVIDFYNVKPKGNWEHGKNILHKERSSEEFCSEMDLDPSYFKKVLNEAHQKLLEARNKRTRPGLDDKILSGWNGLMIKGLCDAYAVFDEKKFLKLAERNAAFIEKNLKVNGALRRNYKNDKATIEAYLEDYAFIIEGYIALYQVTFSEKWLEKAVELTDYTLENFFDEKEGLFFYTDEKGEKLIARKKEIFDNVIPSSNSTMAGNLHLLGILMDAPAYIEIFEKMVAKLSKLIKLEPAFLSNWACQFYNLVLPTAEIAIVGDKSEDYRKALEKHYIPNKVITGTIKESSLPLLEGRKTIQEKTTIYVCYNKTCKLPVNTVEEALHQLAN